MTTLKYFSVSRDSPLQPAGPSFWYVACAEILCAVRHLWAAVLIKYINSPGAKFATLINPFLLEPQIPTPVPGGGRG
jgi:hypothetical protein